MRLAVLSDIHGNLDALQAVLADLESTGGADQLWILGDLAAFGPDPVACLATIRELPEETTKVIQGNTDRYLITGRRPDLPQPTEENWAELAEQTRVRDANFGWTVAQLTWPEFEYLTKLGTDLSLEVPDFGWIVGFHAVPGDDEYVLKPDALEIDIVDALLDREGSVALGGHTHLPMDRTAGYWRMINPGSVGFPFDGDQRAAYAILSVEDSELSVDLRRVEYDVQAVIQKLKAVEHPAYDFVVSLLQPPKP